ncbi:MAG: phosphoserine transaminase [Gammaproteobacteria bacterium]|nr:phosphoserine transaminase [Gammaproteobacteria bacterium]
MKPTIKPQSPNFSSGPCAKRPGYRLSKLDSRTLGRSHRSALGKATLEMAIIKTKLLLGLPSDYLVGIVPASDTGAMEMAMWNLLGPKPVDIFAWESFGGEWLTDVTKQLKLPNVRTFTAPYGQLPDLTQANPDHDVIFTWNGTTSGVKVDNGDWISDKRQGLTICDATSAVFAQPLPWEKLDVITFSWQKVLGGEGAHGVLILSPRAVARLESYSPSWPLPKIFRLTKGGKLMREIFAGATINTPSMLCVVDYIDALTWLQGLGGLPAAFTRTNGNLKVIEDFVARHKWITFLAERPEIRSNTSVCLTLDLPPDGVKKLTKLLEDEGVAYDIGAYRDAPPGIRIWCGATVEKSDLEVLMQWLAWSYHQVKAPPVVIDEELEIEVDETAAI